MVLTCASEITNVCHPMYKKYTCAFKVVEDSCIELEQLDTPFGITQASSLHVSFSAPTLLYFYYLHYYSMAQE